jgi:hypothetical protein
VLLLTVAAARRIVICCPLSVAGKNESTGHAREDDQELLRQREQMAMRSMDYMLSDPQERGDG